MVLTSILLEYTTKMVKISQSALVQQSGNDIYFIIEGPCDGYFTEKVSQAPFLFHDT